MTLVSMNIGNPSSNKNFVISLSEQQQSEIKIRLKSITSGEISTKTKDVRAFLENIRNEIQEMRDSRMTYKEMTQTLNDMRDAADQPILNISESLFYRICIEMGIAVVKKHVCPALTCSNRIKGCDLVCPGNGNSEKIKHCRNK